MITFIAVVGFFMPTSTSGERLEKVALPLPFALPEDYVQSKGFEVNLGINTLLGKPPLSHPFAHLILAISCPAISLHPSS